MYLSTKDSTVIHETAVPHGSGKKAKSIEE